MKGLFNTIGLVIGGIILFFVFFAVGATITNMPGLMRKGSAALYGSISKLDPKRKAAVR